MARTLGEVMAALPPQRRKAIEKRSAELIAEEMTLRQLRQAHGRTQRKLASALNISQDGVSRLEKRSDLLLSTLRSYVEAMGGKLTLVAEFPGSRPVTVGGFDDMAEVKQRRRSKRGRQ
jgi:transcriptional regulator with XRE-family HTH domain